MSYEIEGKLHKVFDIEQKTDKFQSRDFVIVTESEYPQHIKFQLVQNQCDVIDPFPEGSFVKVYFDLRGREWNDKYFTNLQAWRVEPMGAEVKQTESGKSKDDLPF